MTRNVRHEVVRFNELKDVLDEGKRPDSAFRGVVAVQHQKLPKGVTVLVGDGRLGIYDSRSCEAHIWQEKALEKAAETVVE